MDVRRAAERISDTAPGYFVRGLVKTDANGNQSYVAVFEASGPGTLSEEPMGNIRYLDGSPAEVPTV